MTELPGTLIGLAPLLVLAAGLVPTCWANRHSGVLVRGLPPLLGAVLAAAVGAAAAVAWHGPLVQALWALPFGLTLGVYIDGLSSAMLVLISFIGFVITRYSARYLDGEQHQGRFLRWIAFTLGAVMLIVVSGNLVMLVGAWMLSSLGLHQLLTHYPERPWAVWAARKKFLISRLGDMLLISGLVVTYRTFGTFEYAALFAAAESMRAGTGIGVNATLIGLLFALGAMTKSAQFPFHSWLPDTMEAPTPVSALMHAGVINAGGFLVIRLSPLVVLSYPALDLLLVVGALTAFGAALVMTTQASIKRALAWSTIAQMGFMMLQCGLGAFSAAMLHIVAHSLYKTHAFLTCGSTIDAAARLKSGPGAPQAAGGWSSGRGALVTGVLLAVMLLLGSTWCLGIDLARKPGGMVLGLVQVVALTQLMRSALLSGSRPLAAGGLAAGAFTCLAYWAGYALIDQWIAGGLPQASMDPTPLSGPLTIALIAGFLGIFGIQWASVRIPHATALRSLYVHAANGFYLDIPVRRLTACVWRQSTPAP